jgi:hypothetical protein
VSVPALDPEVMLELSKLSSDPTFMDRLMKGFHADTTRTRVGAVRCALVAQVHGSQGRRARAAGRALRASARRSSSTWRHASRSARPTRCACAPRS